MSRLWLQSINVREQLGAISVRIRRSTCDTDKFVARAETLSIHRDHIKSGGVRKI